MLGRLVPRKASEWAIVATNLVPLAGYLLFAWQLLQILLFYVVELCVVELVVGARMVALAAGEAGGGRAAANAVALALMLFLCHLVVFGILGLLLLGVAFAAVGYGDLEVRLQLGIREALTGFLRTQYPTILALVAGYGLRFYAGFLRSGEYRRGNFVRHMLRSLAALGASFFAVLLMAQLLGHGRPNPAAFLSFVVVGKSALEIALQRRRQRLPATG